MKKTIITLICIAVIVVLAIKLRTGHEPENISLKTSEKPSTSSTAISEQQQKEVAEFDKQHKAQSQKDIERFESLPEGAQEYIVTMRRALLEGYGESPAITEDNPQVRSVKEALSNPKLYPERLSYNVAPKPFNKSKYKTSKEYRQNYLNTIEPGRVRQVMPKKKGVTVLTRVSNFYQEVEQGKTITLKVKGEPGFPISFTSIDLGKFDNGLTAITKEADSQGYVEVTFYGMPGTIATTNIMCSSPVCSHQLTFKVFTKFPTE